MMNRIYLFIVMFILTLVYALCFTAIKEGLLFLPPLFFGGLRALLGGIVLLPIITFTKQPILPKQNEWKWILWIGLTTTVTFFGMFLSPGRTGAGIASILGNMSPFFTVILAALVLREKLSRYATTALILGIAGITFISFPDLFGKNVYGTTGLLLALAASGGAATSNIIVKHMNKGQAIIRVSAWQLIFGSLPLFILSLFTEKKQLLVWNTTSISILLFLGIVGTAFVTAAWYLLIQQYNVGKLSLFLFLIPVFGLAIANIVFKEVLGTNEFLGIFAILVSTVFLAIDFLTSTITTSQVKS